MWINEAEAFGASTTVETAAIAGDTGGVVDHAKADASMAEAAILIVDQAFAGVIAKSPHAIGFARLIALDQAQDALVGSHRDAVGHWATMLDDRHVADGSVQIAESRPTTATQHAPVIRGQHGVRHCV